MTDKESTSERAPGTLTQHQALVLTCAYCSRTIVAIPELGVLFAEGGEKTAAPGATIICACGSFVSLDYESGALLQFEKGFLD
jgi:hypothetical protein